MQGTLKTSTKNFMKIPMWESTTAMTKMAKNGQSPFPQISAHSGMILLLFFSIKNKYNLQYFSLKIIWNKEKFSLIPKKRPKLIS